MNVQEKTVQIDVPALGGAIVIRPIASLREYKRLFTLDVRKLAVEMIVNCVVTPTITKEAASRIDPVTALRITQAIIDESSKLLKEGDHHGA